MKLTDKQRAVIRNNIIRFLGRCRAPEWFMEEVFNLNIKEKKQLEDWIDNLTKAEASEIIGKLYKGDYEWIADKMKKAYKKKYSLKHLTVNSGF